MTTQVEAEVLERIDEQRNHEADHITNPTAKRAWVRALRSTAYRQGTGALRSDQGWCCLGVVCEVAREFMDLPTKYDPEDGNYYYSDMSQYLPYAVEQWLGVDSLNPYAILDAQAVAEMQPYSHAYPVGKVISLAELNDEGVPFSIIAGLIERAM